MGAPCARISLCATPGTPHYSSLPPEEPGGESPISRAFLAATTFCRKPFRSCLTAPVSWRETRETPLISDRTMSAVVPATVVDGAPSSERPFFVIRRMTDSNHVIRKKCWRGRPRTRMSSHAGRSDPSLRPACLRSAYAADNPTAPHTWIALRYHWHYIFLGLAATIAIRSRLSSEGFNMGGSRAPYE